MAITVKTTSYVTDIVVPCNMSEGDVLTITPNPGGVETPDRASSFLFSNTGKLCTVEIDVARSDLPALIAALQQMLGDG